MFMSQSLVSRFFLSLSFLFIFTAWASVSPSLADIGSKPELVILTYDTIASKSGLGPALSKIFEGRCGCLVKWVGVGDAAQLVSRLEMDAKSGKGSADLVMGLDQNLWDRARPFTREWGSWKPKGYSSVRSELRVGDGFLPYDHGVFALMVDHKLLQELKLPKPGSLKDLLKPAYKRAIILQDPRVSTPGLAFLIALDEVYGAESREYLRKLKPNWLTLAPGWDSAYNLFLKEEAPLVWSYTSSEAYHIENGQSGGRYQALVFEEGNPIQIEGAALVKTERKGGSARTLQLARDFMEFLLKEEAQTQVMLKNWMLPVTDDVKRPSSFRGLPEPKRLFTRPRTRAEIDALVRRFEESTR